MRDAPAPARPRRRPALPPLAPEERAARKPLPPEVLAGARQEAIHTEGRIIATWPIRARSAPPGNGNAR